MKKPAKASAMKKPSAAVVAFSRHSNRQQKM